MFPAQPVLSAIFMVVGSAGLSAFLIFLLRPWLIRFLLAQPNARSSHKIATPQGAGIAIMVSVLLAASLFGPALLVWVHEAWPSLMPILATALGLTILGALDDAYALPVTWRLIGQIFAVVILVYSLPEGFQILPALLPLPVERTLLALGTVWFINAINFLDGLDWMTVAQVVPMTLGIVALQALGIVPNSVGLLALALLGAVLGFAVFNRHPASIFLGDAGSLPIGLLLAFMLIFVAKANLAAALLLALYTLADATLTLFRRILAGERIDTAHRSHFYQRAVAEGLSVPQVTARVFALEFLLAALAIAAVLGNSLAIDLFCLALGLLATGITLFLFGKGR